MITDRERYFAILQHSLASCEAGMGGSVVLTGPLASGKTTLLAACAAEAAERGFLCLTASGSRGERALTLSVIGQLCQNAPATSSGATRSSRLHDLRYTATTMHSIFEALLELSSATPVLLSIDDLHHVDPHSLRYLVYLVRRIGSSRVLVVAAGRDLVPPTQSTFYADLLDHLPSSRLRLTPLSQDSVGELLEEQLGRRPRDEVVAACHTASRGNPMLVSALAQDLGSIGDQDHLDPSGQVPAGPAFQQAIRRCLYRCEPDTQRILRAGALLDEAFRTTTVPPALTGQLADVDPAVIERTFAELDATGLLHHPLARQTILETLSPADLATMHLLTARLLRQEGLPPIVVARHLLAAGRPVDEWAVPVLRGAASRLLDDGASALAIKFLQLAHSSSSDESERAGLRSLLFRAEWRTDPESAVHRLADLTVALDRGLLSVPDSLITVGHLLWAGYPVEAQRALAQLSTRADQQAQGDIRLTAGWLAYSCPGLIEHQDRDLDAVQRQPYPATNSRDQLADVLEGILSKGTSSHALTAAEQTLQGTRLDDPTLIPISAALTALIHTDQLETAALWCDRFAGQAADRQAPGWKATLSGIGATIALRQGRLAEAETRARTALGDRLAGSGCGTRGEPLATLLRALTLMGRLTEAGQLLEWPVPDDFLQTSCGLAYLHARGHYYLAIDRPDAALDDFLTCGALMDRWNFDLPTLVQWRLDAALAHLRRGEGDRARRLVDDQMAHPGATTDRVRGRALRLLAATAGNLHHRAAMLRDAVELLLASGDRLELAYTLADLGHAYRAMGDSNRARIAVRRAWQLAQDCHAYALCGSLPDFSDDVPESPVAATTEALSAAERRVAALASEGRTNHQIARKLFITESTVEQHLTRVYRKLKVRRRADLPASFHGAERESAEIR